VPGGYRQGLQELQRGVGFARRHFCCTFPLRVVRRGFVFGEVKTARSQRTSLSRCGVAISSSAFQTAGSKPALAFRTSRGCFTSTYPTCAYGFMGEANDRSSQSSAFGHRGGRKQSAAPPSSAESSRRMLFENGSSGRLGGYTINAAKMMNQALRGRLPRLGTRLAQAESCGGGISRNDPQSPYASARNRD
jgi:hypothetical protein